MTLNVKLNLDVAALPAKVGTPSERFRTRAIIAHAFYAWHAILVHGAATMLNEDNRCHIEGS